MTTQEQSRPLHTLTLEASRGLEVTKNGIVLRPESAAIIREQLVLYQGSKDFAWAVRSLLIFASRLEERNGAAAANTLVELASGAAQVLRQQALEDSDQKRIAAAQKTSQFFGFVQLKKTIPKTTKPNRALTDRLNQMPRRA